MCKDAAEGILDALAAWLEGAAQSAVNMCGDAAQHGYQRYVDYHDGREGAYRAALTELKRLRASQER